MITNKTLKFAYFEYHTRTIMNPWFLLGCVKETNKNIHLRIHCRFQ